MQNSNPKYKRILLKLSGEAISAGKDGILNFDYIREIADVIKKCMANGLIAISAGGNVLRLLPPLVIEKEHVDEFIAKLECVLSE